MRDNTRTILIPKEMKLLYNPTDKVLIVSRQIEEFLMRKGKDTLTLPKGTMLGGMEALSIELDKEGYGLILVHWKPNFRISTQSDPFCSSLILKYNTLCKLNRIVNSLF